MEHERDTPGDGVAGWEKAWDLPRRRSEDSSGSGEGVVSLSCLEGCESGPVSLGLKHNS